MEVLELSSVAGSAAEFRFSFENVFYKPDPPRQSIGLRYLPKRYAVNTGSERKVILSNVSGKFRSGRLTAILGPSGSGKKADGIIKLDGHPLSGSKLRKFVSYTEQAVSLWLNLTVEESLLYAAEFQLPATLSKSAKCARVFDLIETLGLEKCRSTLGRSLSGGEYKRLAMGIDLLSDPKVMLLDEPTSGLDTVATNQVVSHMKTLAQNGRIVACVIHQPSSGILRMFDDVFLLSKGNCLYCGPLDGMVPYFAAVGLECPLSHNPADFALEVASMENEADERVEKMIRSQKVIGLSGESNAAVNGTPVVTQSRTPAALKLSLWTQFWLLTKRTTLCTLRDPTQIQAKTAISIFVGVLVGVVFYDVGNNAARIISNTAFFQIVLHTILFITIGPAAVVYPLESAAVLREYRSNAYALLPYCLSKMLIEIPLLVLNTTILIAIIYWSTSQPMELYRIFWFWAICLIYGWIAQMWGLILGCFYDMATTVFLASITAIPVILFSGCLMTIEAIPALLRPLTYVSFERYAFEGYLHVLYGFGREDMECPEIFCYYKKISKYLKALQMPVIDFEYDLLGLGVWASVMTVAFYFCLKRRVNMQDKV
ncbi:conserved hypothetical protein [Culex quinquefasciatus]|uniref:ABC transporter domain-containing protein n=1 Tax=Culex quinquefasciatus TaxID=7176 RepID=B0WCJ4_CULQU|nr:conserved hypothetical protein [Culex quinquefasciatus]|eukprot:XP_001846428.1 conserved hypothetical protein [Culex quinquefasciatus]